MEILPPDLITFSKDAAELLADLQSRNERMFLLTFGIVVAFIFISAIVSVYAPAKRIRNMPITATINEL